MATVTSVFFFVLIGYAVGCQNKTDLESTIDDLIRAGMATTGVPGLSIAVVKDGTLAFTKGYGVKDVETSEPVTADTIFGIASLTKAFTSTLLTKLLSEQGTYKTSTDIYKILGREHTKFNNTLRSIYATLEDLMAHSMGIPRNNFLRLDTDLTRENLMNCLKYLPNVGGFRRSFYYSDLMYGLLTRVTEVAGGPGKTWEELMTTNLFRPLGMMNSTFMTVANFSDPTIATPYSLNSRQTPYKMDKNFIKFYAGIGGSGSIMSSANDMAKYLLFHMNAGKNEQGQQVMKESDLEKTYEPLNVIDIVKYSKPDFPQTMSNTGYALGWRTGHYRGYKMLQHTGSTYGYKAMISMLPETKSAIFTAFTGSDTGYRFRTPLHTAALDLILGESTWINATTIGTFPQPWESSRRRKRSAEPETSLNKDDFAGEIGNVVDDEDSDLLGKEDEDGWATRRDLEENTQPQLRPIRPKRAVTSVQGVPILNFAGIFKHGGYGTVNIAFDANSSKLRMGYGIGQWELEYSGSGFVFKCDWHGNSPTFDIKIEFLVNRDVYGFKCLDCDTKYVPAFYRQL